jgi:TatA/E family protein of Tat protein translocase
MSFGFLGPAYRKKLRTRGSIQSHQQEAICAPTLPLFWLRQYDERMGFSETIFLFFLALIIFGPKKLPEIARQVGKALNEFRRASNEFKAQIEQEIANLEHESPSRTLPAATHVEGVVSHDSNSDVVNDSITVEPANPGAQLVTPSDPVTVASAEIVSDTNREVSQTEPSHLEASQPTDLASDSLTATSPQGSHV